MISIQRVVSAFSTNTYVVRKDTASLVIDPSGDAEKLYRLATEKDCRLVAILLTHGHFDHIDALEGLVRLSGAPVYVADEDRPMLTDPHLNASWLAMCRITADVDDVRTVTDGEELELFGIPVRVYATPGHTGGCVCYRIGNALFSGDTVFADGYGRTDLAGARPELYAASLRAIEELMRTNSLYPGHGRIIIKE